MANKKINATDADVFRLARKIAAETGMSPAEAVAEAERQIANRIREADAEMERQAKLAEAIERVAAEIGIPSEALRSAMLTSTKKRVDNRPTMEDWITVGVSAFVVDGKTYDLWRNGQKICRAIDVGWNDKSDGGGSYSESAFRWLAESAAARRHAKVIINDSLEPLTAEIQRMVRETAERRAAMKM